MSTGKIINLMPKIQQKTTNLLTSPRNLTDNYIEKIRNVIFQVYPPFTFSDSVQPITLECDPVPAGTDAVVTGWGYTVRLCVNYCLA